MEVVASHSQGHTAAAQCGLFTHKSVPVIFEPPCISVYFNLCVLGQNSGTQNILDQVAADQSAVTSVQYKRSLEIIPSTTPLKNAVTLLRGISAGRRYIFSPCNMKY